MRLLRAVLLFITVTLIDLFLTLRGFSNRGEGNPILKFWMETLGTIPGLVILKLVLVGGAVFLLVVASKRGGKIEAIFYAGTIITLCLSSTWLI